MDASIGTVVIQKVDLGGRAHRDGEKVDESSDHAGVSIRSA